MILSLLFISQVHAAIPGKKMMDIEVRIGERESHYVVTESPRKELTLNFINNAKENRRTFIRKGELKELKKIFSQMREPSHDIKMCSQQYIKVSIEGRTKIACESSKTPLGDKMRRFVNLMRYMI